MDEEPVLTCDGDYILSQEARLAAKFYYATGFFGLPWLWACNIWLFFPCFRAGSGDPVMTAYVRKSTFWLVVYMTAFMSWLLVYQIGGSRLFGDKLYNSLNILNLDVTGSPLE